MKSLSNLETEQANPLTRSLSELSMEDGFDLIVSQDASVIEAVRQAKSQILQIVDHVVPVLENGGHLIYVGAGASGFIAALEALEIPPTFGIDSQSVKLVIAGASHPATALLCPDEDNYDAGHRDMKATGVRSCDAVIGVSVSGSTPYVVGALEYAASKGALVCSFVGNPDSPLEELSECCAILRTGPEVISGATHFKGASAVKLGLNILSALSMVRLGGIYQNYMVSLKPRGEKMRHRALDTLQALSGASRMDCEEALHKSCGDVKCAVIMLLFQIGVDKAWELLHSNNGNLSRISKNRW